MLSSVSEADRRQMYYLHTSYLINRQLHGYPHFGVESLRDQPRMVGGERQRAYRYGMTLLCVGALFNWLGLNENNSDPIRFIGYTCLASGALLIFMAMCFWANGNSLHPRSTNQIRPVDEVVVNLGGDRTRPLREKPPDYEAVANLSPPPSYDDAIRLSPMYLPPVNSPGVCLHQAPEAAPEYSTTVSTENETRGGAGTSSETESKSETLQTQEDNSRLTRVIRYSSRLLRRTLSNVDRVVEEESTPPIRRTSSVQDIKNS